MGKGQALKISTLKITSIGPDFSHEDEMGKLVCGIDEAGRAPLAGPVTAACVLAPKEVRKLDFWGAVNDSKKVKLATRNELYDQIREHCFYGIGTVKAEEIDTLNIHYATFLAMRRAYKNMCDQFTCQPEAALIDGKFTPELSCPSKALIKGDSLSLSIAAASILAKVNRDNYMKELHESYPMYGWDTNVGYPTKKHLEALEKHGPTDFHRRSFAPVKQFSLPL